MGGTRGGLWIMVGVLAVIVAVLGTLVYIKFSDDPGWRRRDLSDPVALVTDGSRVCATQEARLLCVEADSGDDIFDVDLPSEATPVALAGDTLVVGADGGTGHGDVYGYSLDGDLLWEATELQDVDIESVRWLGVPLAVAGGVVTVPLGDDGLEGVVALDGASGDELWRQEADEASLDDLGFSGVLISDGQRFYADKVVYEEDIDVDLHSSVAAIDPATGEQVWELDNEGSAGDLASGVFVQQAVLVDDGASVALGLYGSASAEIVVVDTASGDVRWRVPLESDWGGLAHLDDVTVVIDGSTLVGFNAEGGEIWSAELTSAADVGDVEDVETVDDLTAVSPGLVVAGDRLCVLDVGVPSVNPADGVLDDLMPARLPTAVVAADGYLVVASPEGWGAVPLDGD